MSRSDLKQQKTFMNLPKESFQSIDDLYLHTEEEEQSQGTYQKQRSKLSQNEMEHFKITKPPQLNLGGGISKQVQQNKVLFSKPKYLIKSIDKAEYNQSQNIQTENNYQSAERPQSPKVARKFPFSSPSNQLRSEMANQEEERAFKKPSFQQHNLDQINMKGNLPRNVFSLSSKNDAQKNLMNISDLQKRIATNRSEFPQKQSLTQLKENIFAKDTKQEGTLDFKTNQFYGQGPRYDGDGNLVTYSLVGKPEWFLQASEDQKTLKRDSAKQSKLNKKVSMASFASKTSSIRIKNSIDTLSRVDKKRRVANQSLGEQLTKEQLIKKLENVENRIEENKKNDEKVLEKKQLYEKVQEEKQMHQLSYYDSVNDKWEKLNYKLSEKLLRPPELSLLKSSVPQFRQKVEVTQILEQVKTPNELLGNKFWEVTLRDKFIDYTKIKLGQNDEPGILSEDQTNLNQESNIFEKRAQSSHQMNRSVYRELSYSKGTKVPVLFKKEVEIIKHPKLLNTNNQSSTQQFQTLGQYFSSINSNQFNSTQGNTFNQQQPRQLLSQQMSRRPYSQQSAQNISYRARTPFNYNGFANANEFMNSIQNSMSVNHSSQGQRVNLNNSMDKIQQFFTALTVDADELVIKGENKLKAEKEALINDGHPNQFIYKHFNQDEITQLENQKNSSKQKEQKEGGDQFTGNTDQIKQQYVNAQNKGAIQKQSTFGNMKSSNIFDQTANKKEDMISKKRNNNNQSAGANQYNNQSENNHQSLTSQKTITNNLLSQQSIKIGGFNNPFHVS
ncbi:hypothetical protein TTHERM_00287930 (macronuclear) [Tetrahymena thermophila SB210]|uniref:Uncharacterized protein n=1 Tax=Tetrahymena thermophila (strain SB210) TaxID=312017 RepID=I7LVJ7_TETTS|nr:hypothetical protein TTHERM_00287930 [Tetrahymena thermophila SB210]EAR98364.2 hypothetical protein TTHERM_00287930 [Tetrahymena thermophila SB210]|eukprot:XP_001018609.2 hypothetical protein TTHERM_00287930 [Tetrahymena thermophila SB210]